MVEQYNRLGVIDDSSEFLEKFEKRCRKFDITPKITSEPMNVFDWIQNDEIDILLTDIRMPEYQGWQLSRDVKNLNLGIQIIAFTGFTPTEQEYDKFKEFEIEVFFKVTDMDKLFKKIKQLKENFNNSNKRLIDFYEFVSEKCITELEKIEDKNILIDDSDENLTIAQLIDEIKNRSARGIDFIKYWFLGKKLINDIK
jgi:DNA-binding NtrC family response regulator